MKIVFFLKGSQIQARFDINTIFQINKKKNLFYLKIFQKNPKGEFRIKIILLRCYKIDDYRIYISS